MSFETPSPLVIHSPLLLIKGLMGNRLSTMLACFRSLDQKSADTDLQCRPDGSDCLDKCPDCRPQCCQWDAYESMASKRSL